MCKRTGRASVPPKPARDQPQQLAAAVTRHAAAPPGRVAGHAVEGHAARPAGTYREPGVVAGHTPAAVVGEPGAQTPVSVSSQRAARGAARRPEPDSPG